MERAVRLSEVFGISRIIPSTYVTRKKVDNRFINDLTRYKHIVIHGSSKQGKTCLRKFHLEESDYVVVQCTRNTTKESIYETLLKFANIGISDTKSTKHTKGTIAKITFGANGSIPFVAKAKADVELNRDSSNQSSTEVKSFDIDISSPNDIGRALALAGFEKYIILEDFHYLADHVQESISYDLKAFHDNSPFIFIIIGVWLESNKLLLYNGDLSARINTITADRWEGDDLKKIISAGQTLLNIEINKEAVSEIIKCCYGNVGLFQKITYRLCEEYGIWKTQEKNVKIGAAIDVRAVLRMISKEESPRYTNFITDFYNETNNSKNQISKWVIKCITTCDYNSLSKGVHLSELHKYIDTHHPYGFKITKSNIAYFLGRLDKIQKKYKIQPIILEYSHKMLRVMDVNFIVFLSTHYKQELDELMVEDNVCQTTL